MPTPDPITTLAPFRIGPDWLALSMSGPPALLDYTEPQPWQGGRWWVPTDINTRVMSKVFYLTDANGQKLVTVAGAPFSRAIGPPDWMLVQFANVVLHNGTLVELYQELRSMGFTYKGVTRLDLAADGLAGNGGDYLEPIQKVWSGDAEYFGKGRWTPAMRGRRSVEFAYLGSRASNKFLRVYCKTRELKTAAAAHKAPYIRAAWEAALGWDPVEDGQEVNRLEIQVKGRELRRYYPEERGAGYKASDAWIESLTTRERVSDIFASLVTGLYDFRTATERARDATPVIRWDFGAVTDRIEVREREPRHLALTGQQLKTTLKTNWWLASITGRTNLQADVMEIAGAAGLTAWLDASIPKWEKELDRIKLRGDVATVERLSKLRL